MSLGASFINGLVSDRFTDAKGHTMNADIKHFILAWVRVVAPTLFLVATTAFLTIPYSLGHHPGDSTPASTDTVRHMT